MSVGFLLFGITVADFEELMCSTVLYGSEPGCFEVCDE